MAQTLSTEEFLGTGPVSPVPSKTGTVPQTTVTPSVKETLSTEEFLGAGPSASTDTQTSVEPERTMTDLETDSSWIGAADKVYKYETGKDFNPEEAGYDSVSDWFKNRHSKVNWNLTNMGATALDTGSMPDEVKDAWIESMNIYDETDPDTLSAWRAIKNTGYDPITWATLIGGWGVGGIAKILGQKPAAMAAKLVFKEQLKKQLAKVGAREGFEAATIKEAIKQGATKEGIHEARRKAIATVARTQGATGAAAGATYAGGYSGAEQSLDRGLGVIDEETGEVVKVDPWKIAKDAGMGGIAGGLFGAAIPIAGGVIGRSKVNKAIEKRIDSTVDEAVDVVAPRTVEKVKDRLDSTPIPNSKNQSLKHIDVSEVTQGSPKIKSAVTETLVKLNTKAGRLLNSSAALPKALFNAAVARSRGDKAISLEVRHVLNDVNKTMKKEFKGVSQDTQDDVFNKFFHEGKIDSSLQGTKTLDLLSNAKKVIKENEDTINGYLNLPKGKELGFGRKNGEMYLTRTFLSNNDPSYLKKIRNALDGKKVDAEFVSKVENARQYLRANTKGVVDDDTIDGMIKAMVTRLAKPSEADPILNLGSIIDDITRKQNVSNSAWSVLKRKKNLDKPILELLGQERNINKQLSKTLVNQRRLIGELEFLADVDNFAKAALKKGGDKTMINLGGFVSFIPKQQVRFKEGVGRGATENLHELTEEILGKTYGQSSNFLKDVYTSPQMASYIKNGIDYWKPSEAGGSMLGKTFQNLAALGQATQTIFDIPAYAINAYGAFQGLISNGIPLMLLGTGGKGLRRTVKLTMEQYKARSPQAVKDLARLKREGVIDTDLSAEIISKGINAYGTEPKNFLTKAYRKTLGSLSEAYGTSDTVAKLMAHSVELGALKKIYKKQLKNGTMDEDRLFSMASERVRDTMPSYSVASPAARQLSRLPVGTYALFPAEVVRTNKNIVKYALKDIRQGLFGEEKNLRLAAYGAARLTGLATTATGIGIYLQSNNEHHGVNEKHDRLLDLISGSWGSGQARYFLQGFEEGEDGKITARYSNSSQFDAADYIKVPVRQILGRVLAGEEVTDTEIANAFGGMLDAIAGPYSSPKFITDALINVIANRTGPGGRPLYDEAQPGFNWENVYRGVSEIAEAFEPGTSQAIRKYMDSINAEEVDRIGKTSSGFPLNSDDIENWLTTGIRTTTLNLNKSLGYSLAKDIRTIGGTKKEFKNYLKSLKPQQFTPDIANDIIAKYKEYQAIKLKGFQNLSDKVSLAQDLTYRDRSGNEVTFGFGKVLDAATDGFYYSPKEDLILAGARSATEEAREGIFMPDQLPEDIHKLLTDKFGQGVLDSPTEILSKLYQAQAEVEQINIINKDRGEPETFTTEEFMNQGRN